MDIIEFFDPQVTQHLRAYKHLMEHGSWPKGFIDEGITFSPVWQMGILSKIADAHIKNLLPEEKTPLKKILTRYMKGQPCLVCAEGYYEEPSLHNDWGGTFTCSSCGHRTESRIPILQPGEPINATSLDMDREVQPEGLVKDVCSEEDFGICLEKANVVNAWDEYSAGIDQLRELKKDWNSYGADPPNEVAIDLAHQILALLQNVGSLPKRIAPVADGGIVIWLEKGANVEISNSGKLSVEQCLL